MKKQVLVLGGGFAGLWSAAGAIRELAEQHAEAKVDVTLVDRTTYHNIRVRNYESDLSDVCVPFSDVLAPIGVDVVTGEVVDINVAAHRVAVRTAQGLRGLAYDRLVLALGSELVRPPIPGSAAHAFDVDTYAAAARLARHIDGLASEPARPGRFTAVVIGAGLTGIEVATELPERLRRACAQGAAGAQEPAHVILLDRQPHVGSDMGEHARPYIERALHDLGVAWRVGVQVSRIGPSAVTLSSGETIEALTTVWCAGMRANPLAESLPGRRDRFGRLAVDAFMRVIGVPDIFAAGDIACAMMDGEHASVMSCQHGRPMGRFAGHNVAADLIGAPLLPLHIDWYTTILDLGPCGAVYTNGWDRQVIASGPTAKLTKQTINGQRIYPPRSKKREDILAAAAPVVQAPPEVGRKREAAPRSRTTAAAE